MNSCAPCASSIQMECLVNSSSEFERGTFRAANPGSCYPATNHHQPPTTTTTNDHPPSTIHHPPPTSQAGGGLKPRRRHHRIVDVRGAHRERCRTGERCTCRV